jgi:potassium efflux system protein
MTGIVLTAAGSDRAVRSAGPRRSSTALVILGLFLLVMAVPTPCAWATTNPLAAVSGKKADPPQTKANADLNDEEIDANRAKLTARVSELQKQADRQTVDALRATYQDAATPSELEEWGKLTNNLVGILEDHILSLLRYKDYRKALQDKLEEAKSWKGFAEKPPYPLALVDSLNDALESKQKVLKSLDVITVTIESEFGEYSSSLKESGKQVRLAEEALEKTTGKPGELRSRWLLALARLQNEVNQAGAVYSERRRITTRERQKVAQADVDFTKQMLVVARGNYRFSAEELKQKQLSIDEQLRKLRLSLEQAKDTEKTARQKLDAADAAIIKAQAVLAAGGRPARPLEQLLKEQKRQQVIFENATFEDLILNGISQLLKGEKVIWEDRYLIAAGNSSRELRRNELDLVAKWKDYISNKISAVEVLIKSQQEMLASPDAGEREQARFLLGLYQEQEAKLKRGAQFLTRFELLVQRRDDEFKNERQTLAGRLKNSFGSLTALAGRFWYAELYVAEETIIADNKIITRPRSVTVGKVVVAVLIVVIGMWLIRRLKGFLHWLAMHRFKIDANEAHLYTRLLTYLLFIVVLVSALVFVNIPLAVFTFLGGALAIGIGFGAQTLINNFISGLILMFDRTIRMGDVVEVDGHRGRVAAIGMRSSSINRFDGVEMLVPNSVFLQQNVTNWTSSDPRARYSVTVGVAYGSPTREVEQIICKAVEDQQHVLNDPPPYVVFENFGDSALTFTVYFWIVLDPNVNSNVIFSDIRHRINERLGEAGIVIPFPQRHLHLAAGQAIEVKINQ